MSKARSLSAFISDPAIDASEIGSNAVTTDKILNSAVTADKLHTSLDLSTKTVTFADNHISGNKIHGGVISDFASTGIDDNATATALTIDGSGRVGIGTASPDGSYKLTLSGNASTGAVPGVYFEDTSSSDKYGVYTYSNNLYVRNITDSSTRLIIDGSGKVGIGTTNPTTKLDIAGTLGDGSSRLKVDDWAQISQEYNSLPILRANWNTGGASRLYQYSNGVVKNQFLTDGDSYITGGNVGIGTTTPSKGLFNIAEQTDDETVVIDKMYVARNFYFSVGGTEGTKTVTVLLEGYSLTGHMIDMHMSGHYWNNGGSTYYRHSRFYLMRESTSATRINSRQDLFLGGSSTGAIGVPVASYANGYWTITYTVGSGFQHKLHITSTANGSNSIYSISVN